MPTKRLLHISFFLDFSSILSMVFKPNQVDIFRHERHWMFHKNRVGFCCLCVFLNLVRAFVTLTLADVVVHFYDCIFFSSSGSPIKCSIQRFSILMVRCGKSPSLISILVSRSSWLQLPLIIFCIVSGAFSASIW